MNMLQTGLIAQEFLHHMNEADKHQLFNYLLGLNVTHKENVNTSFYTYKNLKKWLKPKQQPIQTFSFINDHNDELIISQLKYQKLFKQGYQIKVFYNLNEYDYHLVDDLLVELKGELLSYA